MIGLHGYQHRYVTAQGLLHANPQSEFAGLPRSLLAQAERPRALRRGRASVGRAIAFHGDRPRWASCRSRWLCLYLSQRSFWPADGPPGSSWRVDRPPSHQ